MVKIKDIPCNEEYLYAKKFEIKDKSLIGIPNYKKVKFVITNVAVYIKIANVLIDISGTRYFLINEISSLKIKTPLLFKYVRYLTISHRYGKVTFRPFTNDCEIIVKILTTINPNIQVLKN